VLLTEKQKIEASAERRKQREAKKFSKQVSNSSFLRSYQSPGPIREKEGKGSEKETRFGSHYQMAKR
jgi:hypothetical protein